MRWQPQKAGGKALPRQLLLSVGGRAGGPEDSQVLRWCGKQRHPHGTVGGAMTGCCLLALWQL